MDYKKIPLNYYWTLIIHQDCSVFIDVNNSDRYVVLDWDNDHVCSILVDENTCTFMNMSYSSIQHEVNISLRTITLIHEPETEEED